jgi:periplasmic divalent cation tolerance protein
MSVTGKLAIVLVTVGDRKAAEKIARQVVASHLAACVGILPQRSVFWWEDKVAEESEHLMVIKTVSERFSALRDAILAMHTYEVPEIISIDITDGNAAYLQWISESVR